MFINVKESLALKITEEDAKEPLRRTLSGKVAKKRGRKPATKNKADATVQIYMTAQQKKTLLAHCAKIDVPVSILLKKMLIDKKFIKASDADKK